MAADPRYDSINGCHFQTIGLVVGNGLVTGHLLWIEQVCSKTIAERTRELFRACKE